jgi:hypothetical protein
MASKLLMHSHIFIKSIHLKASDLTLLGNQKLWTGFGFSRNLLRGTLSETLIKNEVPKLWSFDPIWTVAEKPSNWLWFYFYCFCVFQRIRFIFSTTRTSNIKYFSCKCQHLYSAYLQSLNIWQKINSGILNCPGKFMAFQAKKFREYLYNVRHCVIAVTPLHNTSKRNK